MIQTSYLILSKESQFGILYLNMDGIWHLAVCMFPGCRRYGLEAEGQLTEKCWMGSVVLALVCPP